MNALLELQQVDYLLNSYLETALQIGTIGTFGTKLEHLEQNWNIWNKIGTFGTKLEHLEQNWNIWNNWNKNAIEVHASFVAVLFAANVLVCKCR